MLEAFRESKDLCCVFRLHENKLTSIWQKLQEYSWESKMNKDDNQKKFCSYTKLCSYNLEV